MKLTHFRVSNYKIIDDTGLIPVDAHVTALVGKNESGKTGILRALWKSRNVASAKFDKLLDYPRDRYAKERKATQQVVELHFTLSPSEQQELRATAAEHALDLSTLKSPLDHLIYRAFYKGEDESCEEVAFPEELTSARSQTGQAAGEAIDVVERALAARVGSDIPVITAASTAAKQSIPMDLPLWQGETVQALRTFDSAVTTWINEDGSRSHFGSTERQALEALLRSAERGDPLKSLREWALGNLPQFIYFDNYGQLQTRIHLPNYLAHRGSAEPLVRTQTALFEQSDLDPQEILDLGRPRSPGETDEAVHRRKEKRIALTDSASFGLTGEWNEWWHEKLHKLHFDADGEDIVLKVSDEHNPFKIPFGERSNGFQWFFSFYLVFLVESAKAHKGAILLLDEPGLSLHPTLQAKLIEFFDHLSENNQLIYSTHLPFLVDGNHFERVRTVHLTSTEPRKTVVSNDVRPVGDRDTLFPLQAALGYSIAQTLFMGKRTVIVEGITDYWLLKSLDELLRVTGSTSYLAEDTVLIFAGGTSRLMPLASIMYATTGVGGEQMLILLDSDTEGLNAAKRVKEVFGDDSRLLMLGDAITLTTATIEDLIPREIYTAVVSEVTGHKVSLDKSESKATTNVEALTKAFLRSGFGPFGTNEKAKAALKLVESWGRDSKSVPSDTRTKAESLFATINSRFK